MNLKTLASSLAIAAAFSVSAPAFAASHTNAEYFPFAEIMAMKMIDKNKDGMVSKKEFMDMMTMAWEMNAKKMKATGDMMTDAQFKEFLMYLKAGG
ncbi:EF-hand domain-containing protein [Caenimonas koreensis]|uniref:EF-hand domain-containing protein n=1 Tax=Caenimonas koreensis DSM 17982 TaxID=1121255 RepID=A0A844AUZ0_9BURK|nr:EF-hand domain-containing protein [Caenimonas koreensis]MRD48205.1 hypothetical protein [Caenimonas koreensis DSM 17982]